MIDKIRLLIADEMGVAIQNIPADMKFTASGMDSLEFVELMQAVTEEFWAIPEGRWMHIDSAEDLMRELLAAKHDYVSS